MRQWLGTSVNTVEEGVGEGGDVFKLVAAARLNRVPLPMVDGANASLSAGLGTPPLSFPPFPVSPAGLPSPAPPPHTLPSHLPPHRLYCTPDLTMRLRSTRASVSPR